MTPDAAARDAFDALAVDMGRRSERNALWQDLGRRQGGTRALLDVLGLAQSKSNMRLVQRWVSLTGQQRNPPAWAKAAMADAALDRQIMDGGLEASFDGIICVSDDCRHRTQSVRIDPDNPYLPALLAARREGAGLGLAMQQAYFEAWGPGVAPDDRGNLTASMGDGMLDLHIG